ncbi:fungal-specific transcription factor domain-containing protein [Xylaria sp. CBS 124048]|nr:fungal-specific transcription factor domain-containing protein [Xylaria sp. CBS 124048]
MPFKRTRTGCLTCRGDGYKCDEKKPFCGRCVRLGKECKGYGLKLRWQSPSNPHRVDSELDGARRRKVSSMTSTQRQASLDGPRAMSSGLRPQHAYLLGHWTTTLASLISLVPTTHYQFHAHITPIIAHSPSLRSAVCSIAACHLGVLRNDPSLFTVAIRYQTDAISLLRQNIGSEKPLVSLAIIVMLQITDRLFTSSSEVNHLEGAKAIIARAAAKTWHCDAGVFLFSLCRYHDAVISVSRRTPPVLSLGEGFHEFEGIKYIRDLKIIWTTIGRISSMCSQSGDMLDTEGKAIEQTLQAIDMPTDGEGDADRTVLAYKEAAYIYLHRVWHNVGSPHPTSLKHARDCLNHLCHIPVSSPLVSMHAWPLWTAACETIDAALRDLVRMRLKDMYELRHLPSLRRLERDIDDVWRVKDRERTSTGIDEVDCIQAILSIRQRGADLV